MSKSVDELGAKGFFFENGEVTQYDDHKGLPESSKTSH
jgi:hypothetical protein